MRPHSVVDLNFVPSFRSLIPALQESNKYHDAAEIVRTYQKDTTQAVKLLCNGKHYDEAIHEARTSRELIGNYFKNVLQRLDN